MLSSLRLAALAFAPLLVFAAAASSGQAQQDGPVDCLALHQKATAGALATEQEQQAFRECVLRGDVGRALESGAAATTSVSVDGVADRIEPTARPINPFVLNSWSNDRIIIAPGPR